MATRGSELACWQARFVAERLVRAHSGLAVELVVVETSGDRQIDVPVWEMGGQGVFVKEVQAAVLERRADLAVHSAKDLPSKTAPGLVLACVPVRVDPRDALIGRPLARLPAGAQVATGSVRRRAQLAWLRPDLTFVGLRGNIATRIAQAGPDQTVVVAASALLRLGLMARAAEVLDPAVLLPQVGQGALAIECRADDRERVGLLGAIEDHTARAAVDAERGFLARLGGGCDLPAGAYARVGEDGVVSIDGMLASGDGRIVLRARKRAQLLDAGEGLGAALAEFLLDDAGGRLLLDDLGTTPAPSREGRMAVEK